MLNYHRWIDRLQVIERKYRLSSVYLLLLIIIAFILGGLVFDISSKYLIDDKNDSALKAQVYAKELEAQGKILAARNLEIAVERQANAELQSMFVEYQLKQQALERELAFYRSIVAPEKNADGVAIHGLEMTPSLLPNKYRVKLILTQLQKRRQALKGHAEVKFIGVRKGKKVELNLKNLSKTSLNFQFRYFKVIDTEIILPEDFKLDRVWVKVVVPKSRWTKGSQTEQEYSSQELLLGEETEN